MKKPLIVGLMAVMLIPSFANASWWNPLDWFDFLFKSKPIVVEQTTQVKVEATTTPIIATTTVQATTTATTTVKKPTPKPVVKPVVKETPKPVETPIETPKPQTASQDYYLEVYNKYFKLHASAQRDYGVYGNSKNIARSAWGDYLAQLRDSLSADMDTMSKLSEPRAYATVKAYDDKFVRIQNEYNVKFKEFQVNEVRYDATTFFSTNQYNMNAGVRTYGMELLAKYDKTFGTNYASQFVLVDTNEKGTQFATMFLAEVKR